MRISKKALDNINDWMEQRDDIPSGWIYLGDDKERYVLGQPGKINMLVFGVNPSTAKPGENNLDPTIKKTRKLIYEETECDGWIMVNLYPIRATNPDDLPEVEDKNLLEKNIKVIKAVVASYPILRAWAAWGDAIDKRFYLGDTLYDIAEETSHGKGSDFEWCYRGSMTKHHNPRHPLYMKKGEEFHWFAVSDYAANWRYADTGLW